MFRNALVGTIHNLFFSVHTQSPLCLCGECSPAKFTTETQSSQRCHGGLTLFRLRPSKAEMFKRSAMLILVLAAISLPALAQQPAEKTPGDKSIAANTNKTEAAPSATGDDRYRIGPGDVLDIRFLNRPNLSRDAVRVEGNGMIRMPLIDTEIQAACKTEGELAKEIAGRYLKFYRNPQIDVFIKEHRSVTVSIIGMVNEQGRFQLQRRIRLLELLTHAKGHSEKAGQTINVVHSAPVIECQPGNAERDDLAFSSYKLSD